MKMTDSKTNNLAVLLFALTTTTLLSSCTNYSKEHVVKWTGAFMIDSVTAGAIRLEYSQKSPINNTFASGSVYGISQTLYYYDFKTDKLIFANALNDNLDDLPTNNQCDFNFPLIAYITSVKGKDATIVYDVILKKQILSTSFSGFLSSDNRYLVSQNQLMDISTLDTIKFENSESDLFYFSESNRAAYGRIHARRKPPYSLIRIVIGNALPETIGVIDNWNFKNRSNNNETSIIAIPVKYRIGVLHLDLLSTDSVAIDTLTIGAVNGFMNFIDYSKNNGNFVGITDEFEYESKIDAGLIIGNLYNKFATKNVSKSFVEQK